MVLIDELELEVEYDWDERKISKSSVGDRVFGEVLKLLSGMSWAPAIIIAKERKQIFLGVKGRVNFGKWPEGLIISIRPENCSCSAWIELFTLALEIIVTGGSSPTDQTRIGDKHPLPAIIKLEDLTKFGEVYITRNGLILAKNLGMNASSVPGQPECHPLPLRILVLLNENNWPETVTTTKRRTSYDYLKREKGKVPHHQISRGIGLLFFALLSCLGKKS